MYGKVDMCVFGQEDGLALIGYINGVPQFEVVATGPGLVQTPGTRTPPATSTNPEFRELLARRPVPVSGKERPR